MYPEALGFFPQVLLLASMAIWLGLLQAVKRSGLFVVLLQQVNPKCVFDKRQFSQGSTNVCQLPKNMSNIAGVPVYVVNARQPAVLVVECKQSTASVHRVQVLHTTELAHTKSMGI